jgi:hypothetical protein
MKTVITIFTLPQEIDDLERTLIQLKNSSKYLGDNHTVVLDVTLSLSSYLTSWVSSYIPSKFFEDKFNQISKYTDWCDETSTFNISYDDSVLGCVSQRRRSWLNHKSADNFLWLDTDLIFDERTLAYSLSLASQLETPYYVISPQTVKLWDRTWDCLVNDKFRNEDYGYERDNCDPFIDSGIKGDISVELISNDIPGQPKMKFGGGWFNLISKQLLDVITVPEELGHYGLEDTFLMWGCELFPKAEQYVMKNVVVCEDYKYRNRSHYTNLITPINRKDEFLEIANSNVNQSLIDLKNRLS